MEEVKIVREGMDEVIENFGHMLHAEVINCFYIYRIYVNFEVLAQPLSLVEIKGIPKWWNVAHYNFVKSGCYQYRDKYLLLFFTELLSWMNELLNFIHIFTWILGDEQVISVCKHFFE